MGEPSEASVPLGRRRTRLVLAVSALCWVGFMLATADRPGFALGDWFSDHTSHIHATALFLDEGTAIYRRPIRQLCRPVPARSPARLALSRQRNVAPGDLCWPRAASPKSAPLVINWPSFPRPYPPGQLLFFLPEALLLRYGGAGFAATNALAVVSFLLVAHGCVYLIWLLLVPLRSRSLAWLLLGLSYLLLVPWAAEGVYDGAALLCLLGSLLVGRRGDPIRAFALGAGAFFFHFRALWYLPLLGVQAWRAARRVRRRWRGSDPRDRLQNVAILGLGCTLLTLALATLLTVYPSLSGYPATNVAHLSKLGATSPLGWSLGLVTVGCVALLAHNRAWLVAALLLTVSAVVLQAPQAWPWHSLFLLPLPLVASENPGRSRGGSMLVALVWVLIVLQLAFRQMPGCELALVMKRLWGAF